MADSLLLQQQQQQLVFIPWPVMGHIQIVELAKRIMQTQKTSSSNGTPLSVTVLLMKLPDSIDTVSGSFVDKLCASSSTPTNDDTPRVNFIQLPQTDPTPEWSSKTRGYFIHNLVIIQQQNVSDYLSNNSNVSAVIIDMLCTSMIDVAHKLNLPTYIFFTSPASFLGTMLHFQFLQDEKNQDISELKNSDYDLSIPCLENPIPPKAIPLVFVDKQMWHGRFLHYARDFRKAKGLIINTFFELESFALNSLVQDSVPPVYPVGPILNDQISFSLHSQSSEIIKWLGEQKESSVLFLCFGSQGSLRESQVKELAIGIEKSGHRFLWALRRQSPDDQRAVFPSEYDSHLEILPNGFLDRTSSIGKVVGWVPQLEVLSHPSIGGFVSHCGWNSLLESVWCGVPVATWPLHAEQQMNAFQLVKDLKLGVEITFSYHERSDDEAMVITAGEIEMGIRRVMNGWSDLRRRVEEMRDKSRASVMAGGSSYACLGRLVSDILR